MRLGKILIVLLVLLNLVACQKPNQTGEPQAVSGKESIEQSKSVVVEKKGEPKRLKSELSKSKEKISEPNLAVAPKLAKEDAKEVIKQVVKPVVVKHVSVQPIAVTKPATTAVVKKVVQKPLPMKPVVEEVVAIKPTEKVVGNIIQGKVVAKKCAACHTFDLGGKNKVGPNLFGIMGKKQGSVAGFKYGTYLKMNAKVWDEVSLREWVNNSKKIAKTASAKTKMPAQKITGSKADDLIAYLKSLK